MLTLIERAKALHDKVFSNLDSALSGWFPGLAARFTFGSVLLFYFLNSAATKTGDGFPGFLIPEIGAYGQILPKVTEEAGNWVGGISFFPWGLIVYAGTYAEVILPLAIVLGLFTRLASLAFIGFVGVMTFVDITGHKAGAETIGSLFDRVPDSIIADQRLMWLFILLILVIKGGGALSLDQLLARFWTKRAG